MTPAAPVLFFLASPRRTRRLGGRISLAGSPMPNLQLNTDRDIARASTLPAPLYFSPATFEDERTRLFASTWQVVGHVHQAASPGDYFTFDLIGEPLLIARGDDGILRCFHNVCRHRAGPPASGCGNRKLIRGAQHGDAAPRRYQQTGDGLTADYFWVFPNWMLNCYPDNVSLNIILPLGPERTVAIFEWYLPERDLGSEAARKALAFSDQIQAEDVSICEIVQRNLHSRSYHSGRYSVKQEKGVHAFHQMYRELMPA